MRDWTTFIADKTCSKTFFASNWLKFVSVRGNMSTKLRNADYGSEKYFIRNTSLCSWKFNIFAGEKFKNCSLKAEFNVERSCWKIGTGVQVIHDAEQGKVKTSIVVYFALLWAYGLLQEAKNLANPLKDEAGLRLMESKAPQRSKKKKVIELKLSDKVYQTTILKGVLGTIIFQKLLMKKNVS